VDWSWWRSNPVHLNSATYDDLQKLPGLTNDLVETIIKFRDAYEVLTEKQYRRLADHLNSEAMRKNVHEEIMIFDFKEIDK
jgi:predicted DNA-binding helix-hairpin-helix protein